MRSRKGNKGKRIGMAGRSMRRCVGSALFVISALVVGLGIGGAVPAFADDTPAETVALEVYQDENLARSFTRAELENLADAEAYTYSAFNAFPADKRVDSVRGARVETILAEAGLSEIGDDQVIEFAGNDGNKGRFLKRQIFAQRYYFPGCSQESERKGQAPRESSFDGRRPVPAIIGLYDNEDAYARRLFFGQTVPTEQNYLFYIKYMLAMGVVLDTGEVRTTAPGRITVYSGEASRWNPIEDTSAGKGGPVKVGTAITLDRSVNKEPTTFTEDYWIHFTTDGSEPDQTSALYNYNNFNFRTHKNLEELNKPVVSREGTMIIKTKVIGYGQKDSQVTSFRFIGVKPPAAPKIRDIRCKSRSVSLKWTKVSGASGYKIYRATKKKGSYKRVRTVSGAGKTSWTDGKLKKNTRYYYKVKAFKKVSGKDFDSGFSAVKYKKIK